MHVLYSVRHTSIQTHTHVEIVHIHTVTFVSSVNAEAALPGEQSGEGPGEEPGGGARAEGLRHPEEPPAGGFTPNPVSPDPLTPVSPDP